MCPFFLKPLETESRRADARNHVTLSRMFREPSMKYDQVIVLGSLRISLDFWQHVRGTAKLRITSIHANWPHAASPSMQQRTE